MNLLFDLDGTLAEPFRSISSSLHYALTQLGRPLLSDEQIRPLIGPPLQDSLPEVLGPTHAHLAGEVMRLFRQYHAEHAIADYEIYAGTADALTALTRIHRLYTATSKPWVFARPILERAGVAHHFVQIHGSELSGERSKKADLIGYILEKEGLKASETIMIGDRKHDVIGANAHGIPTIGVLWGYGSEEELRTAGAQSVCKDWAELVTEISRF